MSKITSLVLGGIVAVMLGAAAYVFFLPDIDALKNQNPKMTSLMRIRQTQWQGKGRRPERHYSWTAFANISPYLKYAVIVAEDGSFYQHDGVDFVQLREAMRRNWEKGRLAYGGSTITQQLAKNLYLSPSRNPLRKAKEALIAFKLEKSLSKRRILELYLNVVEWGPEIYGAEAASHYYFGISASELNPVQAAHLAAYLPSPLRYSKPRNAKYVSKMAARILRRMQARGFLDVESTTTQS